MSRRLSLRTLTGWRCLALYAGLSLTLMVVWTLQTAHHPKANTTRELGSQSSSGLQVAEKPITIEKIDLQAGMAVAKSGARTLNAVTNGGEKETRGQEEGEEEEGDDEGDEEAVEGTSEDTAEEIFFSDESEASEVASKSAGVPMRRHTYRQLPAKAKVVEEEEPLVWSKTIHHIAKSFYVQGERLGPEERATSIKKLLEDTAKFFEANNFTYFIESGTLLGSFRSKQIDQWDVDADIGIMHTQLDAIAAAARVYNNFASNHVLLIRFEKNTAQIPFMLIEKRTGTYIDWGVFRQKGAKLTNVGLEGYHNFTVPADYVFPLGKCEISGRMYACPGQSEKYLRHQYPSLTVPWQNDSSPNAWKKWEWDNVASVWRKLGFKAQTIKKSTRRQMAAMTVQVTQLQEKSAALEQRSAALEDLVSVLNARLEDLEAAHHVVVGVPPKQAEKSAPRK